MIAIAGTEVRVFRDIDEIDPALWDSIVPPDEVQSSHAFVRACQHSGVEDAQYWHLLVERAGRLLGVATLSLFGVRLDLLSTGLTRRTIELLRRARPSLFRPMLLVCGLPVSAGRPCLAIREAAAVPDVVAGVAAALQEVAAETGADLLCVKEFTDSEAALFNGLLGHGFFLAASLPSFRLEIPWRSFDEYLAGMRSGYRRQAQATLRARQSCGLRVRRLDSFAAECPRIFELYEQVIDRAEFRLERLNLQFFRNLADYLPDRTSAILVEQCDRPLAAAVLLRSPNLLTFFMAGIDYERNRECCAYLNLSLEVVTEAIRTGVPAVELGQTSPALKSRLGGTGQARHLFFRCPSPLAHRAFRSTSTILFPASVLPRRRVFRAPELAGGR